jgi:hypothetical protein
LVPRITAGDSSRRAEGKTHRRGRLFLARLYLAIISLVMAAAVLLVTATAIIAIVTGRSASVLFS